MKKQIVYYSIGLLLIMAFWLISSNIINNPMVIPKIDRVFNTLKTLLGAITTYMIIGNTILRLLLTVLSAFIISLLLAIFSYYYSGFEITLKPVLVVLKTTPIISIIIILLLIFGKEYSPNIITAFVIMPIMYEGILNSFQNLNQNIIDEVKLLTNHKVIILIRIFLPITLPYILTSIIQSFGLGLKVMIMAEFIAQPRDTIGYNLMQANLLNKTENIFAWTIILIAIVMITDFVIKRYKLKNINKNGSHS